MHAANGGKGEGWQALENKLNEEFTQQSHLYLRFSKTY
jgi:hypothetical protein